MNIDIENEPDADESLVLKHRCGLKTAVDSLILDPALRLLKEKMARKHHYKINAAQDKEHRSNAELILQELHDRRGDSLCQTESHDGNTCRKALVVLKPEHQCLYRRQVSNAQTDAHYASVEDIYQDQCQRSLEELYRSSGTQHSCCKTYS